MVFSMENIRKALWIGALLATLLLIAGCAGIKPYHPPNHREEGPPKGLFTGFQGEWVILGPKAPQAGGEENKIGAPESETDREQKKDPEESTNGE
jgi:hypothetical protein